MDGLRQELKELIITTLGLTDVAPGGIGDDTPLFGDGLGLDSLDALELVVALEYEYGIEEELSDERAREVFSSVTQLATFVAQVRTK